MPIGVSALFLLPLALGTGCREEPAITDPAKAITRGWKDYDAALYDEAERQFAGAADKTPASSDLHLRALYGQAATINLRRPGGNPERAKPVYRDILRLAPQSDPAAWSALALARMVHLPPSGAEPKLPAVVAAYQPVIDQFPFHRAGEEAFAFQQAARVASFQPAEVRRAADEMERFVAGHPDSVFRSHVCYLLSRAYENLHEPEKALAAMIRFSELYRLDPRNPRSDYAATYWNIATLANYRVGDFATARKYYTMLVEEYPTEQRVFSAKLAMQKMDEIEEQLRSVATVPAPTP